VLLTTAPSALRQASWVVLLLGIIATLPCWASVLYATYVDWPPPKLYGWQTRRLLFTWPCGGALVVLAVAGFLLDRARTPGKAGDWDRRAARARGTDVR
jgi:hypothetical protein